MLRKTITVILISFMLSFSIVYVLNHYGKISFLFDYNSPMRSEGKVSLVEYIPAKTKIKIFYFESFFGNKTSIEGGNWTGLDVKYESEFHSYFNKSSFYLRGTLSDLKQIVIIGIFITILLLLIVYYKQIRLFIVNIKNKRSKCYVICCFIITLLISALFYVCYKYKESVDLNYEQTTKIEELNQKNDELVQENDELKDKLNEMEYDVQINELDARKNELDVNFYKQFYDNFSKIDDNYSIKQKVSYKIIRGTRFEKFITNYDSSSQLVDVEIYGKNNVLEFYQYMARETQILLLMNSYR